MNTLRSHRATVTGNRGTEAGGGLCAAEGALARTDVGKSGRMVRAVSTEDASIRMGPSIVWSQS
ncbi:hypothetical protein DSM101010T_29790 [Desulfovibrio subterraneus]|uniref:Uncharacterized protein n=1 Tax=Desulfovibrio subterraneus TaxID=2718620 RepID=A0A7J0BNK3_9BACT|nr:hypothetical protein DSM101010T_29790 [Desulfovibrio subterraneus]